MTITLGEIAFLLDVPFEGDASAEIHAVATLEHAVAGQITFLANKKYEHFLSETKASAIIMDESTPFPRKDVVVFRMKDPYFGFVKVLRFFNPKYHAHRPGIHPSAVIDETATLGESITVGANAVIGNNARIGNGSVVCEGTVLGDGVTIGEECYLHPNVTIIAHSTIGSRVIVHAGTTIGSDGFGFAPLQERYEKIPQVGTVLIEDNVEIGANCAIDRGTLDATIIRKGAKLDNLIQIAHNVEIGENTVIAAQSGISGSTTLGNHVIIAGQVGVVGHITIDDNITVGAQSGVSKSIHHTGKTFRGSPAHEIHEELKQEAAIRRLPDLIETMRALEKKISTIQSKLKHLEAEQNV